MGAVVSGGADQMLWWLGLQLFHRLRRLSMELELARTEFAGQHELHPTDLRALVHLLDAARAGEQATPGWLGHRSA